MLALFNPAAWLGWLGWIGGLPRSIAVAVSTISLSMLALGLQFLLLLGGYRAAFGVGCVGGAVRTLLSPLFAEVLLAATFATIGLLGSLGAVIQAKAGAFAPGACFEYPGGFVVAAAVLLVVSLILQVLLDPEGAEGEMPEGI